MFLKKLDNMDQAVYVDLPLTFSDERSVKKAPKKNIEPGYWNNYRIGDIFKEYADAPACDQFPKSIGCKYILEKTRPLDIDTLLRILYNWRIWPTFKPKNTVLHLRLGDGLCLENDIQCHRQRKGAPNCWKFDSDCWSYKQERYTFSYKWYLSLAKVLNRNHSLIIVSDDEHWTRYPDPRHGDRSVGSNYKANVINFFRTQGFNVVDRLASTPDNDFAFMSATRVFVKGGGGYSNLIAQLVQARGGTVYEPSLFDVAAKWSELYTAPNTIVTAYFPIPSKHQKENYQKWMQNFLSLHDAMVIFTDASSASFIKNLRAHATKKTYIIIQRLEDTKTAKLFDEAFWKKQFEKDPEKKIHRDYRLYWIWNEKTNWLNKVVEANPFNSTFFAWVDIGYFRTPKYNFQRMIKKIPSSLHHNQVLMLWPYEDYMVGGGFIGGYASGLKSWHKKFYATMTTLKDNFIGKDQITMWRVCETTPEMCSLVVPNQSFGDLWFFMAPFMMGFTNVLPKTFFKIKLFNQNHMDVSKDSMPFQKSLP